MIQTTSRIFPLPYTEASPIPASLYKMTPYTSRSGMRTEPKVTASRREKISTTSSTSDVVIYSGLLLIRPFSPFLIAVLP